MRIFNGFIFNGSVLFSYSMFCSWRIEGRIHVSCYSCVGFRGTVWTYVRSLVLRNVLLFLSFLSGLICRILFENHLKLLKPMNGSWHTSSNLFSVSCKISLSFSLNITNLWNYLSLAICKFPISQFHFLFDNCFMKNFHFDIKIETVISKHGEAPTASSSLKSLAAPLVYSKLW